MTDALAGAVFWRPDRSAIRNCAMAWELLSEILNVTLDRGQIRGKSRPGFSPIHLFAVCVLVGGTAVLSVPRLIEHSEREKFSNALSYLSEIREAQEIYQRNHGVFASDIELLDLPRATPTYFSVGEIVPLGDTASPQGWSLSMTRCGGTRGFGPYTVTFTNEGFDVEASRLPPAIRR